MTITAKILADSISQEGKRLTTFELEYPRFVHAEFMTHRVFSRNASSSRAIPVKRMIERLRKDPAMPVFWGSNKPGMQAGAELSAGEIEQCKATWLDARDFAIAMAEDMMALGLHKQIANRLLEPWAHIKVVATATEWDNFFALRRHPDAQPEIRVLAETMWHVLASSEPTVMMPGEWHLPYVTSEDHGAVGPIQTYLRATSGMWTEGVYDLVARKLSAARCARTSYANHDGTKPSVEADLTLFDLLATADPMHASPMEHQATPDSWGASALDTESSWAFPHEHGNLVGWRQFRRTLPGGIV